MANYFIFNEESFPIIKYAYNIQMSLNNNDIIIELSLIDTEQVDTIYNKILQAEEKTFSFILRSQECFFNPIDVYKEDKKLIFKI